MLHLHRAARADRLVTVLAHVLAEPAGDVFTPELVAVHSHGFERWLAQELSTRLGTAPGRADGVCANVVFRFPWHVVGQVLAATDPDLDPDPRSASGANAGTRVAGADHDPWRPARLVWPLLELLEARLDEPWLAALRQHLRGSAGARGDHAQAAPSTARRFAAARHVADLFDRYAVHRPGMLQAWLAGHDVDGVGKPIPDDLAWQPQLWRALRAEIGVPSLAERLDDAAAALREGRVEPDLPPRVSLFGLTALPASYVQVLAALAEVRDVHLFLLHPSPALWASVAGRLAERGEAAAPLRRDEDPTRTLPRHPLLANWGRDAREMQVVLHERLSTSVGPEPEPEAEAEPEAPTLLARLQHDIRHDRAPGDADAHVLAAEDRSLQVHACHGRTRQVEVMRDAVLHLLDADPSLEPRDVVVMCPDIETFAPIVHAVFGAVVEAGAAGGAALPDLRVRLADRALRQTNPVLRVVADLLALADGRLTASEVLDLAGREPVRRRFGFDDDALERFEGWVAGAGIRWGLDADHRTAFGLDGVAANTWRAGLDRLLLGIAMPDEDDRLVGGAVPLDDVEGNDVDVAGRFAEYVGRLAEAVDHLAGPHTVEGWRAALTHAADLLTATTERDRWQHVQLHRVLDDVVEESRRRGDPGRGGGPRDVDSDPGRGGGPRDVDGDPGRGDGPRDVDGDPGRAGDPSPVALELAEVRSLLEDRLAGRPSRANHRTGDLTVCTLVPMRSVPHKVVCLLGMDDEMFPRRTAGDGDDLIEREPCVGDRDARTEDRQLLLDALLAAERHLVVAYTGHDERTNEPRPPAVPIGELLDVVDATGRTGGGASAADAVRVEHPLQSTDARNFEPGRLVAAGPWGFDPTALAGAQANGAAPRPDFLAAPLPPDTTDPLGLDQLVRFLEHPVKAFLRRRLDVVLPSAGDEPSDAIPVELGPLERYAVGERLLAARLGDADVDRWTAAERARGVLPPGALAGPALADVTGTVERLLEAAAELCDLDAAPEGLDVDLALADGRRLVGTVPNVCGDVLLAVRYSKAAPKYRLVAWVHLLAATAAHPERPLRTVTVGRHANNQSPKEATSACIPALADTPAARERQARAHLERIVDLFDRGMRAPLPLPCKAAEAYASAARTREQDGKGKDPHIAASDAWTTDWIYPCEDRDPEHLLVYGEALAYDDLAAIPPAHDERGEGWYDDEPGRLARCARRLWDPLLTVEKVDHW